MAFTRRIFSVAISSCSGGFNWGTLLKSEIKLIYVSSQRFYSSKKPAAVVSKVKAGAATSTKYKLQPVQDVELLTTQLCGGNIMKDGNDPILKPDSEYPDWLWEMDPSHKPVPLEELSDDTWEYWRRVLKLNKKRKGHELALKYKQHRFSTPPSGKK